MTGRPKVWTEEKLNQVKYLVKYNTSSEIGKIFDTTKNAVLGALPPSDSKYAKPRKRRYFFRNENTYGERNCNICEKTFIKKSRFDIFCDNCRKNIT